MINPNADLNSGANSLKPLTFPEGYIPSKVQAQDCPPGESDLEIFDAAQHDWDPESPIGVVSYESLRPWLQERAEFNQALFKAGRFRNWYEVFDWKEVFDASQGSSPSCAGFGFNRARLIRLMNQILEGSEQFVEKENAGVLWALSKGSVWGGQTLQAMALAGRTTGSFPASKTVDYSASSSYHAYRTAANRFESSNLYQTACAQVPEAFDLAEEIQLACQAGCGVFVGNLKSVDGFRLFNGLYEPEISRGGAHATAFGGFDFERKQCGWWNSWGAIYDTNLPPIGGPMSLDSIKAFMNSSYCDVMIVPYSEAPQDPEAQITLNPNE